MLKILENAFAQSSPISPNGMGFDPGMGIQSRVKPELSRLAKAPSSVSRGDCEREAFEASRTEAAAKLFQKWAQLRARRMRATAQLYATAAQHQQGVLRTNSQMMKTDERYGKFLEEYLLDHGTTKQSLDGYQQGFQSAQTLVG